MYAFLFIHLILSLLFAYPRGWGQGRKLEGMKKRKHEAPRTGASVPAWRGPRPPPHEHHREDDISSPSPSRAAAADHFLPPSLPLARLRRAMIHTPPAPFTGHGQKGTAVAKTTPFNFGPASSDLACVGLIKQVSVPRSAGFAHGTHPHARTHERTPQHMHFCFLFHFVMRDYR